MPPLTTWLFALWQLQPCQGLAPAAASSARPRAPLPPAGLPGGDEPQLSDFDLSIEGVGRAPREYPRWHSEGGDWSPADPPRFERLKNLRWLHIPKAGTSLIATIWNFACGQKGAPLDLYVDANFGWGCGQCYDFALMDRYPLAHYCEKGALAADFGTQHAPAKESELSSKSVVGFFRRPSQRIISAHRNGLHSSGLGRDHFRALVETCGFQNASCFARWPGIAGCSAKMLAGHDCADPEPSLPWDGGLRYVESAVANIDRMRFVGITEEWDESVCLFHRMFGGRISPAEFKNFHSGQPGKSEGYDEAVLDGFVDEADELVYAAAKRRFAKLKAEYAGGGSACGADLEISHAHAQGSEEELSCAAQGWECGLLPGAQLDCGRCPPNRVAAPGPAKLGGVRAPACLAGGKCDVRGLHLPPNTFSWYHPR